MSEENQKKIILVFLASVVVLTLSIVGVDAFKKNNPQKGVIEEVARKNTSNETPIVQTPKDSKPVVEKPVNGNYLFEKNYMQFIETGIDLILGGIIVMIIGYFRSLFCSKEKYVLFKKSISEAFKKAKRSFTVTVENKVENNNAMRFFRDYFGCFLIAEFVINQGIIGLISHFMSNDKDKKLLSTFWKSLKTRGKHFISFFFVMIPITIVLFFVFSAIFFIIIQTADPEKIRH